MASETKAILPSNKLGITFGLATGLSMVVYNLILRMMHVPDASWLNFMVLVIYLVGVLWFCYIFSKNENHDTSFGGMFKGGFRMIAIVTIVLLTAALLTVFIDPSVKKEIMDNNLAALVAAKKTKAEIDSAMKLARDNFTLMIVMNAVFTNIFYGVIFALVGAGIFKKSKA
ncbi:DUF4199 domain-containing protein [Taibaiella lutea]|uniref:DUF4199 domain-containing protein n=1 Tax=Taibaiella lutea TaxID=2608001 RepID=A0A5M6CT09_9BACT|nr:DUF4199 domain-containing protein [Taibaiella lutea]KAA5536289.1 DUF4199 domain-containing protein [Taibaiella lutea]